MGIVTKHFIATFLLCAGTFAVGIPSAIAAENPQNRKTITVSGIVKDSDNEVLTGAIVYVKGQATTNMSSALTDIDGRYTLTVPEDATLIASLLGFEDQEQAVGGRQTIDFILTTESTFLSDAVVVGYGTDRKSVV